MVVFQPAMLVYQRVNRRFGGIFHLQKDCRRAMIGSTFRRSRESSHAGGVGVVVSAIYGGNVPRVFLADRIFWGWYKQGVFFFFLGGLCNKHLTYALHEFVFSS